MRLVVVCQRCKRQYDAAGRGVGSRFHCHCGETLLVAAPQGHDAAVVRCSGCGAARNEGAASCQYCSADFTLHEQDMHTVCPGCLAIVSDRARFCHHCAMPIQPEQTAGEESEFICPSCESQRWLMSRRLGEGRFSAFECPGCAGLWLGQETFDKLVERAMHTSLPSGPPRAPSAGAASGERWRYRPCPVCRQLMPRQHYARRSGVIVDVCRDHGIWFDAHELPQILDWVRVGGLSRTRDTAHHRTPPTSERVVVINNSTEPATHDWPDEIFLAVGRMLSQLFRL